MTTKALVLRTAGTNCDEETCHALGLVGVAADKVHVNELIARPEQLGGYQILILPGGFSYGDDVAAGKILANQLIHHLQQDVRKFIDDGKLVLGICNGFQVLVRSGLLPATQGQSAAVQSATLASNDSGKFEARWVYLEPGTDRCVFIEPGQRLYLPVAHAEGKLCFADDTVKDKVLTAGQVAFRYVGPDGQPNAYPANPNGSTDHIAGLCDPTGRVLGLMPHPERFIHPTQHPRWTREKIEQPDGLTLFARAAAYFA